MLHHNTAYKNHNETTSAQEAPTVLIVAFFLLFV